MEYDVPDEIEILPNNHDISSGPDSFDSILLEHKMGTQGTLGTVLEGVDEVIQEKDDGQSDNETQDTEDIIKPENTCTASARSVPNTSSYSIRLSYSQMNDHRWPWQ